jgi:hypothetical protein
MVDTRVKPAPTERVPVTFKEPLTVELPVMTAPPEETVRSPVDVTVLAVAFPVTAIPEANTPDPVTLTPPAVTVRPPEDTVKAPDEVRVPVTVLFPVTAYPPDVTVKPSVEINPAEAKKVNINVFAEHALEKMLASKQKRFVISDWRFPHEIAFIMSQLLDFDHIQVRINRPGLPALEDPSEHALDKWMFDVHITNNDLRNLEKDVVNFVTSFK